MLEINKDLVRWRRGKWFAVVCSLFVVQLGAIIWASRKGSTPPINHHSPEPQIAYAPAVATPSDWLELENPFLFAGASRNGFSGEAWLRKPDWTIPEPRLTPRPEYLALAHVRKSAAPSRENAASPRVHRAHTGALLPAPPPPPPAPPQTTGLKLSGFGGRVLATPLPLPVQVHSDVLANSVVEAIIDRDGLVISARLIENSGSAKADSDALALTDRARFAPINSSQNLPVVGKLIFEWFTLHLSDTNNVKR